LLLTAVLLWISVERWPRLLPTRRAAIDQYRLPMGHILFAKYIYMLAFEMPSPRNQHCANSVGTLSFPMVLCRLRSRHPLHDGLVWSRRPPWSTRRNQYDAAGALARTRRVIDLTRC